eukprot:TRINITY_DN2536_c0_g1_i1.p1 TRINITY_DN2536_c0_g1~~TRINITY_DN2536_c0_g1_i1.p1  ORF type:complete len:383 (-),score=67.81 TRINITY_DN2536_c0_g1_i1:13-1140(-)
MSTHPMSPIHHSWLPWLAHHSRLVLCFTFGMGQMRVPVTFSTSILLRLEKKEYNDSHSLHRVLHTVSLHLQYHISPNPNPFSIQDPINCVQSFSSLEIWPMQLVITVVGVFFLWMLSVVISSEQKTSDPSITDRLWSIVPIVYVWTVVFVDGTYHPRLLTMATLVTMWGARLTYNFAIKGGYSGGEDYRWIEVRRWYPGWKFEAFNFIFIHYQQLVILAFTTPIYVAQATNAPFSTMDWIGTGLFLALLSFETIADIQQFRFQTEKYRRIANKEDLGPYAKGFIDSGLWSITRHPNYFGEMGVWWAFQVFSIASTGEWLNWTLIGPVFLSMLFVFPQASIDVAENLSAAKYKQYAAYQRSVSRIIPWFPSARKEE